jgi:polar amino acid transport system permease protein
MGGWHFEVAWRNLPFLLSGVRLTVLVAVLSIGIAQVLGLMAALARLSRIPPLRWLSAGYVDFARSTPLLVQLIWAFFALPILLGHALTPIVAGTAVLSLHAGAYLAETYRAGILSFPLGQRHAGLALGMTGTQVMTRIILPQALVRMLPPTASTLISLVKDSSLVSIISMPELMWQTQSLAAFTLRPIEVFTVAALLYFTLSYPLALLSDYLHRRYSVA